MQTPKAMPHSIEAEQALVGALLVDNRLYAKVRGIVWPGVFYEPSHALIWGWASELLEVGRLADAITLHRQAETDPMLKQAGGPAYVVALVQAAETVTAAYDYALLVNALWRKRQAIALGEELARIMAEPASDAGVDEALQKIREDLAELLNGTLEEESIEQVLCDLEERLADPALPNSTGLVELDDAMGGGLHPGRLHVFLARPKSFKTGSLLSLVGFNAAAGIEVAYVDAELGRETLSSRFAALMGDFPERLFKQQQHPLVRAALDKIRAMKPPIHLRSRPGMSFDHLRTTCEQLVQRHKVRGLALDYLQKITGYKAGDKVDHLARVAAWLHDFCAEHQIWGLAAAQLGKSGDAYMGEGVIQACDWAGRIHLSDTKLVRPDIAADGLTQIWVETQFFRHGQPVDCGRADLPALYIHPNGPRLASQAQPTFL